MKDLRFRNEQTKVNAVKEYYANLEKRNEKRKHIENIMREREKQKNEQQQKKWSRREEQNFLKTIMAYGIEFSKKDSSKVVWDR